MNYEGSPLVTPGSLWQNYLRLNQAARVEAYPVLTSEYVKEVKTSPTESEIRAIYEEGAGNFPSPTRQKPGSAVAIKLNWNMCRAAGTN